jgi:N-acetylglucosamine kinase-like BadF-type ATPase
MVALGIDAGGSSTRWRLADDTIVLAEGKITSISGHVATQEKRTVIVQVLSAMLGDVLNHARPQAVVAGITGLSAHADAATFFQETLAKVLELPLNVVTVYNDITLAYLSAFKPGEGVVVYAGTGSIAYHLKQDGSSLRAGGFGYLIDDAGGGFWIGREGLKKVLRWMDATGKKSNQPLAIAMYEALGVETWADISPVIYEGGRSKLASLAPAVARAAQNDEAAMNILQEAGRELAQLAVLLLNRLETSLPVAFVGGITALSPVLEKAFKEALPAGAVFQVVNKEPVEAAVQLALQIRKG